MSARECSMAFLVEARHDGRLGPGELATLERHLGACASCSELAENLGTIRAAMQAPLGVPSALSLQRGRVRLLRAAAVPLADRRPIPLSAAAAVLLAAGMAAALAIGLAPPAHRLVLARLPATLRTSPSRPMSLVVASEGARYQRERRSGSDRVRLVEGAATCFVRHLQAGERFVVATADATVEVQGTVFRVEAVDDQIQSVVVTEGEVVVTFRGHTTLVGAGETWSRSTRDPDVGGTPDDSPSAVAAAPPRSVLRESAPRRGRGHGPSRPAESETPEPAGSAVPLPVDDGSGAFLAGMRAMERGEYAAALRGLSEFAAQHPDDARAEDAAFTAIVALERLGKGGDAAAAAREYLARYPHGYRRLEAGAIASQPRP